VDVGPRRQHLRGARARRRRRRRAGRRRAARWRAAARRGAGREGRRGPRVGGGGGGERGGRCVEGGRVELESVAVVAAAVALLLGARLLVPRDAHDAGLHERIAREGLEVCAALGGREVHVLAAQQLVQLRPRPPQSQSAPRAAAGPPSAAPGAAAARLAWGARAGRRACSMVRRPISPSEGARRTSAGSPGAHGYGARRCCVIGMIPAGVISRHACRGPAVPRPLLRQRAALPRAAGPEAGLEGTKAGLVRRQLSVYKSFSESGGGPGGRTQVSRSRTNASASGRSDDRSTPAPPAAAAASAPAPGSPFPPTTTTRRPTTASPAQVRPGGRAPEVAGLRHAHSAVAGGRARVCRTCTSLWYAPPSYLPPPRA